jgi:hypothetical protein
MKKGQRHTAQRQRPDRASARRFKIGCPWQNGGTSSRATRTHLEEWKETGERRGKRRKPKQRRVEGGEGKGKGSNSCTHNKKTRTHITRRRREMKKGQRHTAQRQRRRCRCGGQAMAELKNGQRRATATATAHKSARQHTIRPRRDAMRLCQTRDDANGGVKWGPVEGVGGWMRSIGRCERTSAPSGHVRHVTPATPSLADQIMRSGLRPRVTRG